MHLTNSLFQDYQDEKSSSFSKYVAKDAQQLMYDSSSSYNSQTLLLDASQQLEHLQIPGDLMKKDKGRYQQEERKEEWLFENSEEKYSIGDCQAENHHKNEDLRKKARASLPNIIKNLVAAIKHLEQKVQKLQSSQQREQQPLQTSNTASSLSFDRYPNSGQKNISKSISVVHTCSSIPNSDTILIKFVELLQLQSQIDFYRQENKQLKEKLAKSEASWENMQKLVRKYQGENSKLKELLKQYHNFKKRHGNSLSDEIQIVQNKDINESMIFSSRPASTYQNIPLRFGNINLQQLREKERILEKQQRQREEYIRYMQRSAAKAPNISCLCKSFSKYIENIERKQHSEVNPKHMKERDNDSVRKAKGDNLFHSVKQVKYAAPKSFGQYQSVAEQDLHNKNWSTLDSKQNYPQNKNHQKQQRAHHLSTGLNFYSLSSSKTQNHHHKSTTNKDSFVNSYRSPLKQSSNQIQPQKYLVCKSDRF